MSAGSDAPAQLGVAKVAYHAALVAAPAYVLQPMVLLAIFALTLLTLASSFGALTGSFTIALLAPMAHEKGLDLVCHASAAVPSQALKAASAAARQKLISRLLDNSQLST